MASFEDSDSNPPSYLSRIGLGALMKDLRDFRESNSRFGIVGKKFHPMAESDPPPACLTSYKSLAGNDEPVRNAVNPEHVDKPESLGLKSFLMAVAKSKGSTVEPDEDEDDFDLTFRPTKQKPMEEPDPTSKPDDDVTVVELKSLEDFDLTELEKKIIRQCEYYFGDFNLPKDRFMRDLIDQENGWLSMATMLTFPRLHAICKDPFVIMSALEKSPNQIIEVDRNFENNESRTSGRIRRHPSKALPEFSDERRQMLQDRTVFVSGFPKEGVSLDDLIEFFENGFDKVIGVRMRTARKREESDSDAKPDFLGSAFVTFASKQAADMFVTDHGSRLSFGTKKLFVTWQTDFFNEKPEYTDKFRPDVLDRTVYVAGFDRQDTQQSELVAFFGQFNGAATAQKRVYRERKEEPWRFAGSVFVTFEDSERAEQFLALPSLTYNGDKLIRKSQLQFFTETGKFSREIQIWRKNNEEEN